MLVLVALGWGAAAHAADYDSGPHRVPVPSALRPVHRIELRTPQAVARADVRWIGCSAADLTARGGPPHRLLLNCVGRFRCRGAACPMGRGTYILDLNGGDRLVDVEATYVRVTRCLTSARCRATDQPPQAATLECGIPYYDGPYWCRPANGWAASFEGVGLHPGGVWLGRSPLCRSRIPYDPFLGGLLARCASDDGAHRRRRPGHPRSNEPAPRKPDIARELR